MTSSLNTPTINKLRAALADMKAKRFDSSGCSTRPSEADREHRALIERKLWNAVCRHLGVAGILVYQSNNSGGSWWLSDDDWNAMHGSDWSVHWIRSPYESGGTSAYESDPVTLLHRYEPDGSRWLSALARSAAIPTSDPNATVAKWERLTGQNAGDQGCNCCGRPHDFTFYDRDGESHTSGIEVVSTFSGFDS